SLAPWIGSFGRSGSMSAVGRVSQWARSRTRSRADGLKRARTLDMRTVRFSLSVWSKDWTRTVSARARRWRVIQASWAAWPARPATRGPNWVWRTRSAWALRPENGGTWVVSTWMDQPPVGRESPGQAAAAMRSSAAAAATKARIVLVLGRTPSRDCRY